MGFYGMFFYNLLSMLLFWLSFLFFLNDFFFYNFFFYLNFGKWLTMGSNFSIYFDFFLDTVSVSFAFLTMSIGVAAYCYSFSYFSYEPNVESLVMFLNLFMMSMMFLVTSGNLISLFLGWELIGLTSFLLMNFWIFSMNTFKAAFKAYSFNKASDVFLFFAVLLLYHLFNTLDFITMMSQVSFFASVYTNFFFFKFSYIDLMAFFFILCAFIKSAQIGPHMWLPDSMEAPVPASALIHSATLVSAGVFLILRFYSFFELSFFSTLFISFFGSMTAFLGGFMSMHQSDTKKMLAYSTMSHCGFLMVVASTGLVEFCILYLYMHGFFKAAVFMCVGNVNSFNKNIQDFKKMGYFWKYLPFECYLSAIGLLNLSGLPFTLGFFMKHFLFLSLNVNSFLFYFVFINCLFGAVTGLFYSSSLFYNSFFDFKKGRYMIYNVNKLNLNSIYYSNTSLASNLAISFMFFLSYMVSFYLLMLYTSNNFLFNDFFFFKNTNSFYFNFQSSSLLLENFCYINYITIVFIVAMALSSWRFFFLNNYFFVIFLLFFCYFFVIFSI